MCNHFKLESVVQQEISFKEFSCKILLLALALFGGVKLLCNFGRRH